jgi:hypothetical protein
VSGDFSLSDCILSINKVTVTERPPTWLVEYQVQNASKKVLWLIVEESLTYRLVGRHLELSYARSKMQPGTQPFGYFDPQTTSILPGRIITKRFEIAWPLRLSNLWNADSYAAPLPGAYKFSLKLGVATEERPDSGDDDINVEDCVLLWQKTVSSPEVETSVPNYNLGKGQR